MPSNSRFRLRFFFFSISTKSSLQNGNMPLIYICSTTQTNFHYFNGFKVFVSVQSTCQIIHAITLFFLGDFLNEIRPGCIELWRFSLSRSDSYSNLDSDLKLDSHSKLDFHSKMCSSFVFLVLYFCTLFRCLYMSKVSFSFT